MQGDEEAQARERVIYVEVSLVELLLGFQSSFLREEEY
jgi:hypothetical protein